MCVVVLDADDDCSVIVFFVRNPSGKICGCLVFGIYKRIFNSFGKDDMHMILVGIVLPYVIF